MRILHVISNLEGGGAQRQLGYLAAEQVIGGHDVHVAYTHRADGCGAGLIENSGAALHELAPRDTSILRRNLGNHHPDLLLRLASVMNQLAPDVVQSWLVQAHILAGGICLAQGRPWILREPSSPGAYPRNWKSLLMNMVGRRADSIVSNSAAGDHYWAPRVPAARRVVIRNGVPPEAKEVACTAGDEFQPGCKLVLYAGRLTEGKNVLRTVDALIRVAAGDASVSAVFCGEGPLRARARSMVAASPAAGRIWLPGFRNDCAALMRRAAACVSLSHFEGSPNSVLEAMSAGCPLVVSDIPSHREILDETCACLVDRHSVPAIAAGVRAVLADPAAAGTRAAVARERALAWSIPAMAGEYEKLYRTILSKHCGAHFAVTRKAEHL